MSPHARFGNETPGEEEEARADATRDAGRGPRWETRVAAREEPGAVASRGGAARAAAPCAMAARPEVTNTRLASDALSAFARIASPVSTC